MPAPVYRSSLWLAFALGSAVASDAVAAPSVANDSYSVNVNASLSVPVGSGLLANDTGFNATTHRLESSDEFSQFGGRVTVAADGSFSYQPVPGFRGVDNFQYTVRDATGASTAQVSIDVSGETVWFVDDSAPAGGNGTRSAPFNSFAPVNGNSGAGDVDANGDTIFVFAGTYDVTFDLEPGQKLVGEAAGLDLVGTANDVPAGTRPLISSSNSFPLIELFGAGGSVREFNIANSGGKAISGGLVAPSGFRLEGIGITSAAGASGAIEFGTSSGAITIIDVAITGATQANGSALSFLTNSGTITLTATTVSAFTGGYVLNVAGNSGTITFDSTSDLSSSNTRGLAITTQSASGTVTLAGVDLNGGAAGEPLIRLQGNNATSRVVFAEGVLADATTTDTQAFSSDGGRLRIDGSNSVLTSTDGPALYLESVELLANATFTTLSSTSSNARGISVDSPVGSNDVIVSGTTTISSPTTEAIRVNSASASGFLLQLATLNSTGGTVGISVTNAAVTVSNSSSAITTSAGPAVVCTSATANLDLATLTAAGGNNGVSFDSCAGTVTAAAGTLNSTAGAGNAVVNLVGGGNALNFTYGGTINKTTAGAAVNILGLANPGAATFNGTVTGTNASAGVSIQNSARPVTFTTLNLGTSGARFASTPITLAANTGAVNLGNVAIYTNAATALNISYANASPGQVSTGASSLLDVTGAATALVVSHAAAQPLNLQFASIANAGAGTHGINLNRASGTLTVAGLVNLGAKTTAGVQISNSSLATSLTEVDINGAADGIRLSNNTGSFTILGDGNFVSLHTDGAGGTFTNLTDNAFDLNGVSNVRATDVTITGTGSHGITGTGVSGTTTFSNVDFSNIGNADNEHVFNFQEGAVSGAQASGSLEINNSIIQNFTDNGLYLENFSGNLDFRWTDNTLRNNITTTACSGGNCNGNGLLLRADGTARINAFIQNAVFEDIDGIALTANPEGNSGARMDIAVVSSAFTAEPYGGPSHTNNGEVAISLRNAQGNSTLNFRLFSNDIRNYTGEFALGIVAIEGGDFTTTNGVVSDLYIYNAHEGDAVGIFSDGANTLGSGTTNYDLILSFNNVRTPGGTAGSSFYFAGNGAISGSDANAQITLTNSQFPISPTKAFWRTVDLTFDSGAANFNRACFDIRNNQVAAGSSGLPSIDLYYISSTQVRLEGMSGSGDTNAQTYLNANNTLGNPSLVGVLNNITSAVCTDPTLPVAFPFN